MSFCLGRILLIAAETGMSHANVYQCFPSKELLADAVLAMVAPWLSSSGAP
jgi:AcrR family transcriptional regulator